MGLLSSSQVVNDGTSDRTFLYQFQVPSNSSAIGSYVESTNLNSTIMPKHEMSNSKTQRSVVRFQGDGVINSETGETAPITVNISVAYNKKHSAALVEKQINLALNTMKLTGVVTRFVQRFI